MPVGKFFIVTGIVLVLFGVFLTFGPKLPFGRLPGDLFIERGRFTFSFPIATRLILSLLLTLVLNLFFRR